MSSFDWPEIRKRYEEGESAAHISKDLGGHPTRQAIHQRIKSEGWEQIDVDLQLPVDIPSKFLEPLTFTQQLVVREIVGGATQKEAAGLSGIHPNSITRWKKESEDFECAWRAAVAVKNRNRRQRVETSPDAKDARWLLERDPDSRQDYSPPVNGGGAFQGNTFNILGQFSLGIQRDHHGDAESGDEPAPALVSERDE